jgi:hypothetical protein
MGVVCNADASPILENRVVRVLKEKAVRPVIVLLKRQREQDTALTRFRDYKVAPLEPNKSPYLPHESIPTNPGVLLGVKKLGL